MYHHQWTIYERPADYPDSFVVRRWTIRAAGPEPDLQPLAVVTTLEQARASLPPGLVCLTRSPDDPPCVVEVWI